MNKKLIDLRNENALLRLQRAIDEEAAAEQREIERLKEENRKLQVTCPCCTAMFDTEIADDDA
jgi:cell shape-determining protein MreC